MAVTPSSKVNRNPVPAGANTAAYVQASDLNQIVDALTGATGGALPPLALTATGTTEARTPADRAADVVNVRDFGAKGDGVTDDTAAIQAAVAAALSTPNRATTVVVTGRCRVTSSIIINRLVDTTVSELHIVGQGLDSGFYTSGTINVFDSTIPVTTAPQSEFVTFDNIRFEAASSTDAAYVFAPNKFLRIKFINCLFYRIKALANSIYSQTWHFINCNIRRWDGIFFSAPGAYDTLFQGNIVEAGGRLVDIVGGADRCSGLRLLGNLIEGLVSGTLRVDGNLGTVVQGNYFEANGATGVNHDLNFQGGGAASVSILVAGNFFSAGLARAGSYGAILWPSVGSGASVGNSSKGTLHVVDNLNANIISIGDKTDTAYSGDPLFSAAGVMVDFKPQNYAALTGATFTGPLEVSKSVSGDATVQFTVPGVNLATIRLRRSDQSLVFLIGAADLLTLDPYGNVTTAAYIKAQRAIIPIGPDRGDASFTLAVGTDPPLQRWATTLTANRTVNLATATAQNGDTFRIVRTGLGAFTLDVGGLKTIPSATAAFVDVAFSGTAWVLTGYGAL